MEMSSRRTTGTSSRRTTETEKEKEKEEEAKKAKEAELRAAVEAELARRAPAETACGICCKSYADIAAANASSSSQLTAVLPCCHTVCRACVYMCAERSGVACPICLSRFDAIARNKDVEVLPRNPFVEDAVNAAIQVQCSQCIAEDMVSEESAAVTRCDVCAKDLCELHTNSHRRKPASKDHVVLPLASQATVPVDFCAVHNAPLNTYCINCKVLVCLACTLKNGRHPATDPAHHTVLMSEHMGAIKATLAAAKQEATRRQMQGVAQLVAIRTTKAAADEREARLTSDIKRSFAVMVGTLQRREATLLEEVAKLTAAERTALEAAAGVEQLHWTALQGGVVLTEQLLATGTAPVRVGQLAHTASAHLIAGAQKSVGPTPSLDEIQLFVDPSVQKVLETVGAIKITRVSDSTSASGMTAVRPPSRSTVALPPSLSAVGSTSASSASVLPDTLVGKPASYQLVLHDQEEAAYARRELQAALTTPYRDDRVLRYGDRSFALLVSHPDSRPGQPCERVWGCRDARGISVTNFVVDYQMRQHAPGWDNQTEAQLRGQYILLHQWASYAAAGLELAATQTGARLLLALQYFAVSASLAGQLEPNLLRMDVEHVVKSACTFACTVRVAQKRRL